MKIVMFTPALKTSAIGRMASLVTRALISQGHEVTVVRTEKESFLDCPTHDFGTELIPWNDFSQVSSLAGYADVLVYQIGNNYEFHHGSLEWLPRLPGIVCLHDFFVGHLFNGWAQTHRPQADATLRAWYGDEVAQRYFRFQTSEAFIDGTRDAAPMTDWICSMAHGVVTHSSWGIERVLKSCPGPVYVIPLAYDAPKNVLNHASTHSSFSDPFRILTIGHINQNKRVASVISAIGTSPVLRKGSVYRLVGNIEPETVHELSALASKCQVNLFISGEVDDATLMQALKQTDVVSCLRWPSLEAASASAIEAMLYGKPTIVTNTGFYREIPDNCVKKIDPENEISSLQSTLEHLLTDSQARYALGTAAKTWAEATFTSENYAQKLIDIAFSVNKAKPMIAAANYFTEVMSRWGATRSLVTLEETLKPLNIFGCRED